MADKPKAPSGLAFNASRAPGGFTPAMSAADAKKLRGYFYTGGTKKFHSKKVKK